MKVIKNFNLYNKVFILGYVDEKDMYSFYKNASLTSFVLLWPNKYTTT